MNYRTLGKSDVKVACTIPGFRNEPQVRCNLSADGFTLSSEDRAFLRGLFE